MIAQRLCDICKYIFIIYFPGDYITFIGAQLANAESALRFSFLKKRVNNTSYKNDFFDERLLLGNDCRGSFVGGRGLRVDRKRSLRGRDVLHSRLGAVSF